jgi:hypothetical protein
MQGQNSSICFSVGLTAFNCLIYLFLTKSNLFILPSIVWLFLLFNLVQFSVYGDLMVD